MTCPEAHVFTWLSMNPSFDAQALSKAMARSAIGSLMGLRIVHRRPPSAAKRMRDCPRDAKETVLPAGNALAGEALLHEDHLVRIHDHDRRCAGAVAFTGDEDLALHFPGSARRAKEVHQRRQKRD